MSTSRKNSDAIMTFMRFGSGTLRQHRVAIIFNDISERVHIQESIRFQAQLLNSVEQSVIATDLEGKVIYWNRFAERMFGFPTKEAIGRRILELTTPDIMTEKGEEIMDRVRQNKSWEGEFLVKRKNGTEFLAHVVNSPVTDAEGDLIGIIGISIDLEERRRMEAALRRSEERLRLIMESFTDFAILTMDVKGIVESWNPGAENIFGYPADEMMGRSGHILFTPEDRAVKAPERELATARDTGRAKDERWHLRKDGSRFYASGITVPLYDGQRLLGYAKIARDLTEQKHVAEQLQQSREMLEDRVSERTEELNISNVKLRGDRRTKAVGR